MRKKTLILLILVFTNFLQSQTLKKYVGDYNEGFATYQYFENAEYERIFHGDFLFEIKSNSPAKYVAGNNKIGFSIRGFYQNNKKEGVWESKEVNSNNSVGGSAITILKGNYINGLKNGLWKYSQTVSMGNQSKSVTYIFNFHNDTLHGKIDINGLSKISDASVNGSFNIKGNFIGDWIVKYDNKEYIAEFENNIFKLLVVRNISDGEIIMKYKNENVQPFLEKSIVNIDGNDYALVNCSEIDLDGRKKNEYFRIFYDIISEKIFRTTSIIEVVPHGSSIVEINSPKLPLIKI